MYGLLLRFPEKETYYLSQTVSADSKIKNQRINLGFVSPRDPISGQMNTVILFSFLRNIICNRT